MGRWEFLGVFAIAAAALVVVRSGPPYAYLFGPTTAAWVQAGGVFAAIYWAGRQANRQAEQARCDRAAERQAKRVDIAERRRWVLIPDISHLRDQALVMKPKVGHFNRNWTADQILGLRVYASEKLTDAVFDGKADAAAFAKIEKSVLAERNYNAFLQTVSRLDLAEHPEGTLRSNMAEKLQSVVKACEEALGVFG